MALYLMLLYLMALYLMVLYLMALYFIGVKSHGIVSNGVISNGIISNDDLSDKGVINSTESRQWKKNFAVHNYCLNSKFKKLIFACFIVCGFCAKLIFPDSQEFINQYDIICLIEIKTDRYDAVNIDGYKFISVNKAVARRKPGGVGLFIKNVIWPYAQILDNSSENCLRFMGLYIFHQEVRHTVNIFDKLEQDIINFCAENTHTCLMGDYNAKSGGAGAGGGRGGGRGVI